MLSKKFGGERGHARGFVTGPCDIVAVPAKDFNCLPPRLARWPHHFNETVPLSLCAAFKL